MTVEENEIIPRILRDMNDGVLVVGEHGEILYLNDRGRSMLGVDGNVSGQNYSRVFLADDTNAVNDGFHQFVLDAIYDKEHTHIGEAVYQVKNQELKSFRLTSSFLHGEDGKKKIGLVVVFSDITEVAKLNRQRREASTVFSVLMICVCVYLFLWSLLRYLDVEPPGFFPKGAPFWDWSILTFANMIYPFTVILQEFLARGVMQENLRRIFAGKYAGVLSIVVSALVFGVLHIAYGLPFMLAASLLLGVLGVFYHKQGNIWGLCIIHYVLGQVATFLRYLT